MPTPLSAAGAGGNATTSADAAWSHRHGDPPEKARDQRPAPRPSMAKPVANMIRNDRNTSSAGGRPLAGKGLRPRKATFQSPVGIP